MFLEKYLMLCEEKDESPTATSIKIGFSKTTVTHWKNGKTPKIDAVLTVAEYFDVSIDWLLDRTENRYAHKN